MATLASREAAGGDSPGADALGAGWGITKGLDPEMALLAEHLLKPLPADRQIETGPFLEAVAHLPPFFGECPAPPALPTCPDLSGPFTPFRCTPALLHQRSLSPLVPPRNIPHYCTRGMLHPPSPGSPERLPLRLHFFSPRPFQNGSQVSPRPLKGISPPFPRSKTTPHLQGLEDGAAELKGAFQRKS